MPTDAFRPEDGAILIGFAIIILGALLVLLVVNIFFILTLRKALMRCSEENRTMSPGLLWLNLIPLFSLIWNFFIVINVAESLHKEFQKRGIVAEPYPGKNLGLAFSILAASTLVLGWIPIVGGLPGLAGFVCWIIYWIKIAGFSKQIESPYEPISAEPQPSQPA
jgi:hypothetical protein